MSRKMKDYRKLLIEARKMLDHFLGDDSCMCQACLLCRSIDAALAEPVKPVAFEYTDLVGNVTLTHQPPDRLLNAEQYECRPLYAAPAEQDRVDAERWRQYQKAHQIDVTHTVTGGPTIARSAR